MKLFKNAAYFSLFFFSACATVDNSSFQTAHQPPSPYTQPAEYYQQMAENAKGEEISRYKLELVGRLLEEYHLEKAGQELAQLQSLSPPLEAESRLLRAKRYLLLKKPSLALKQLSQVQDLSILPEGLKTYYYQLLSQAYKMGGKLLKSVQAQLALDEFLIEPELKKSNNHQIWRLVSKIPLETKMSNMVGAQEPLLGWLRLNAIREQHRDDSLAMQEAISSWQLENPTHPANELLTQPLVENSHINATNIALLLPLTGPLAGPGRAVRDGFMAAYFQGKERHPTVKFYDTHGSAVITVYKKAVSNGADFVIGPLTKDNIKVLSGTELSIPVLSLNELPMNIPGLYQFGLSPLDEVPQLVEKAFEDGHRRALVISPEGVWGESISQSFVSHWRSLGGMVVDTLSYAKDEKMDESIQRLLKVSESQSRRLALSKVLHQRLKFIPRRRQDFDVIFMLAYPSKARQIKPLLRYFYAGSVPVYSPSLIYAGKPNVHDDMDLNGIVFTDMPWMLQKNHRFIQKSWPEQFNSYNRLFAMGKDAYLLSGQLNQLTLFPALGLEDNTGRLYLNRQRKIKRKLSFARFKSGLPKSLDKTL